MNHYEVLGVGPHATDQDIKEAYRREAMKWHPDRHDGAIAKSAADRRFKDLAVAYRTLRDAAARADYDRQLEQQLRREYETRQQEQARRERAQREQAAQQRDRRQRPREDFADTGPQFTEETVSGADANQMFEEQMLDLALELAGRGFPEFNIFKALVALGCPEALAKAVAATAAKQGHSKYATGASDNREEPLLSNFDEASFEEMEPYYVAAIMGSEPLKPISEERYGAVLALRKRRGKFWLMFGLLLLVAGGVLAYVQKNQIIFPATVGFEIVVAMLWVLSRNFLLGPDQARFRAEETKRYYLDCFRTLHQEKLGIASRGHKTFRSLGFKSTELNVGAFLAMFGWFGYRRLHALAYIWAATFAAISYAIELAETSGTFKWSPGMGVGLAVGLSVAANRMYFNKVRANILSALDQPTQRQALTRLRNAGGTSRFGWILPWVFYFLLSMLGLMLEDDTTVKTPIAQEQHAAQLASAKASNEAHQRVAEQQTAAQADAEFVQYLRQIRADHPELNKQTASFSQAAVDWLNTRHNFYLERGQSRFTAMQLAMADYMTTSGQPQPAQPALPPSASVAPNQYISFINSLSARDRYYRIFNDMGVAFPMVMGTLTYLNGEVRPKYSALASEVERSQIWGVQRQSNSNNAFMFFQNRAPQSLKGVVIEIQAEEGSCDKKGSVYHMTLAFDRTVLPASVAGISFMLPPEMSTAKRCLDIIDLIYG